MSNLYNTETNEIILHILRKQQTHVALY